MQSLTKALIAIDSVTGNEGAIGDFLIAALRDRGLTVRTFSVTEGRHNILAYWPNREPRILFNTHIDTVPEQYGPHEDEERIYGRGACDTHGVLAAQLEAMQDLHTKGVENLGVLLVVGEETDHDGAIHAGKSNDVAPPDVLIVGEPTENKLMTFQKGRLKADLTVYGREGHSGYPEKFDSAVEKLFFFLNAIWCAPWLTTQSDDGTTVNVTIRHTDKADNQVSPVAKVRFMFRCATACADIKQQVEKTLQSVAKKLPAGNELSRHFDLQWLPGSSEPVTNLNSMAGFETGVAAYNTDIHYFGWQESRTFLLGPGSILQAHRDFHNNDWLAGEWISKNEQIKGVELYTRLVEETLI